MLDTEVKIKNPPAKQSTLQQGPHECEQRPFAQFIKKKKQKKKTT